MEAPQRNGLLSMSNKISAEINADKVIRELATLGILHPVQIEDIKSHKSSKLKSARLLEILTSCGPKAFISFYDVLMKAGHRKLAEQLRKSAKDNKVAEEDVKLKLEQDRSNVPVPRGYDDALRNCKEGFIRDVWSEHLMAIMEDQDLIGEHTRQIIDGGTSREERSELLFWNLVHQLQKKGHSAFIVVQDALEQSYPHIGDLLWENVKSIVAPPRSSMESRAARDFYSPHNNDEKTDDNQDEKQDHEQTREGDDEEEEAEDSKDVIATLEELQSELSDTKTDNVRHSMQLERAIQVIAEANGTIRVLEARILNLEQERDNANMQADMAHKEAGECRVQVEVVRRGREQERTRQQDHLVKWEAQQKDRMNQLDQKDAKLRSKENSLKRREDDVKQQLQLIKRQQSEIERRTKDLLHKTDIQERTQDELNNREEKVRQKERLLQSREQDISSREEDASRKEDIISKGEVKLKRREIEAKRLEEQLKIMQEEINRQDSALTKKDEECRRKEQDQQIQDDNLQKREDSVKIKERRIKMKFSDLRQQEGEQKMKEDELRSKEQEIEKKDYELKNKDEDVTQRAIDVESREKDCEEREEKLEQDEEDMSRRETDIASKEEAVSNLQYILDQRNTEQEKIDRTLKMMELEQRRMELEQIRREQALIVKEQEQLESERLNESQSQKKLDQLRSKMEQVERRAVELEQKEELLGRIELEQRMRELEYSINDADDGDDFEDSGIMDKPESVFSDAGIIDEEENFREYIIVQKGVRNPDPQGKPYFTVKVSAPHTISTLKTILAAEEGIPVAWQRLYINNRLLDESSELPDSDVPSEMALDMKLVVPSGKVRIPVKASRGAANVVEFDPSETIAMAKVRIFKHGGIPPHQQRLLYKDKPLEEHCTVESLNLRKNAIIHLRLRLRIMAQISRVDTVPITIDESDTVKQLKELIQEATQLPADTMKIYYNKRELDDHRPVSHFGITEDATLQIVHSITFAIRPGTESVSIEIDPGATARQLKQLLRRKNLKIERPTIIAGDKVLGDEQTIMEALQKGDTFEIHSGNVLVVLETGEIIRNAKIQTGSYKKGSSR